MLLIMVPGAVLHGHGHIHTHVCVCAPAGYRTWADGSAWGGFYATAAECTCAQLCDGH